MVVVVQLRLPLVAAYVPRRFRSYFNGSKHARVKWHPPNEFAAAAPPDPAIYLVSGPLDFVLCALRACKRPEWALVTVEGELHGLLRKTRDRRLDEDGSKLAGQGLHIQVVSAESFGAPLDAAHVFGFGSELSLPTPLPPSVPRALSDFIMPTKGDAGAKTVAASQVPGPATCPGVRRAMVHNGALLPQGLLCSRNPSAKVFCDTVYHPGRLAVRPLVREELLRVYQLPLSFDRAFADTECKKFPFVNSPPPEVFALLFRLLWGGGAGGGAETAETGTETARGSAE